MKFSKKILFKSFIAICLSVVVWQFLFGASAKAALVYDVLRDSGGTRILSSTSSGVGVTPLSGYETASSSYIPKIGGNTTLLSGVPDPSPLRVSKNAKRLSSGNSYYQIGPERAGRASELSTPLPTGGLSGYDQDRVVSRSGITVGEPMGQEWRNLQNALQRSGNITVTTSNIIGPRHNSDGMFTSKAASIYPTSNGYKRKDAAPPWIEYNEDSQGLRKIKVEYSQGTAFNNCMEWQTDVSYYRCSKWVTVSEDPYRTKCVELSPINNSACKTCRFEADFRYSSDAAKLWSTEITNGNSTSICQYRGTTKNTFKGGIFDAAGFGHFAAQHEFNMDESVVSIVKATGEARLVYLMDDYGFGSFNSSLSANQVCNPTLNRGLSDCEWAIKYFDNLGVDVTNSLKSGNGNLNSIWFHVYDKAQVVQGSLSNNFWLFYAMLYIRDESYKWQFEADARVRCKGSETCLDKDKNHRFTGPGNTKSPSTADPVRSGSRIVNGKVEFKYDIRPSTTGKIVNKLKQNLSLLIETKQTDGTDVKNHIRTVSWRNPKAEFSITEEIPITASMLGKTFCRYLTIKNGQFGLGSVTSPYSGTAVNSNSACVYVPYDYNLVPNKPVVPTVAIPGGKLPIPTGITVTKKNNNTKNGGEPTKSTHGINPNNGTTSKNTRVALSRLVSEPPGSHNVPTTPKFYGDTFCEMASAGGYSNKCDSKVKDDVVITGGGYTFPNDPVSIPGWYLEVPEDLPVGSKVCFILSVQPPFDGESYDPDVSGKWLHGTPGCVTVAKQPKVQIRGGSVVEPFGPIKTSASTLNGKTFGSWGEFDALANQEISVGFASGRALLSNNGIDSTEPGRHPLIFANSRLSGGLSSPVLNFNKDFLGRFGVAGENLTRAMWQNNGHLNLHNYFSGIPTASSNTNVTGDLQAKINSAPANKLTVIKLRPGVAKVDIGDLNVDNGKQIVILGDTGGSISRGVINITGNINVSYSGISRAEQITQVLIVTDGNINIRENVKNIDAWLVASAKPGASRATLSTCDRSGTLSADVCKEQLVINGPVLADRLKLRRTAYSDVRKTHEGNDLNSILGRNSEHDISQPAEIINLRSDAYLWAYGVASKNSVYKTTSTKIAPPRL